MITVSLIFAAAVLISYRIGQQVGWRKGFYRALQIQGINRRDV